MPKFKKGDLVAYATKDRYGYQYTFARVEGPPRDGSGSRLFKGEPYYPLRTVNSGTWVGIPESWLTKVKTVWAGTGMPVKGEN